ncbi:MULTISPECIES: helix-turn-helix domain-containing protein [Paenibacillus]|uniref:helix-turn-helix domain-containing protein n=1 Tax=Paenibacillus TaxID=44249 RepID=UPI0022B90409|nr:helix-turn-helix domain-containing protein [Paenibacillus caseinilyticus]MCZ8522217.1 helix-turn-helix domain-containing protein [Paenibacillus caseinilyticus]
MNSNSPRPGMGVLNLQEDSPKFRLTRHTPSGELSFFVKHYWIVRWELEEGETHLQEVIPNPCVNLVVERNKSAIFGPSRHKFTHLLQGRGCVFGVKFKPGGFYPFFRQPASSWTGRPLEVSSVFGGDPRALEESILLQSEERRMIELAEALIRPYLPPQDGKVALLQTIVERIMQDREMTRVDHIAGAFGLSVRRLQRLFHQYVGLTPKWVIQLYRLQNAAEAIEQGRHGDALKLSVELGYHDQAHFIKAFKSVVGRTPDQYAKETG